MCVCGTELPAEDREKWETFISGQLADTNKRNTVDLVSNHMNINSDVEFFRVHVGCTIQLLIEAFFICVGSEVSDWCRMYIESVNVFFSSKANPYC